MRKMLAFLAHLRNIYTVYSMLEPMTAWSDTYLRTNKTVLKKATPPPSRLVCYTSTVTYTVLVEYIALLKVCWEWCAPPRTLSLYQPLDPPQGQVGGRDQFTDYAAITLHLHIFTEHLYYTIFRGSYSTYRLHIILTYLKGQSNETLDL